METKKYKNLRWFSIMNPWMDFVVTVSTNDAEQTKKLIKKAIDDWWEDDRGFGYGDFIEDVLEENGILYHIQFHRADTESAEYEELWEASLPKYCETII